MTIKPFDPALMSAVRGRFCQVDVDLYGDRRIYLENSGGALRLKSVAEMMGEMTALPDNMGRQTAASRFVGETVRQGLADIRTFLGATGGQVCLSESTTSNGFRALGAMIRAASGSNVVTTCLDHPATFDATRILAERCGKQWRVAGVDPRTGTVTPETISEQVDADTAVVAAIHSSNILGTCNDAEAIIAAVRRASPDAYIVIDGAQHAPHDLVDVAGLGCDAYLASSYKTFGKVGASALHLSDRAAGLPHDRLLGKPETEWELGTREVAGYASWSLVLEYLCWLGGHFCPAADRRALVAAAMGAIRGHELALTRWMLRGSGSAAGLLDLPGVTVYGETADLALKEPVVAITVAGLSAAEVVGRLGEQGIAVVARVRDAYSRHALEAMGMPECVRVSCCHYTSLDDIDTFLTALAQITG
jgi:cysteine desulfurase / selenocysteine lyase